MRTTDDRSGSPDFASTSVLRHLARGAAGFGAMVGAFALIPVVGPVSLLLAPAGLVALRGCPTCWTIGLLQTISAGRLQRRCVDGRCELHVADRGTPATATAEQGTQRGRRTASGLPSSR